MSSDFGFYQQGGQGGQGGERLELRARRVGELLVRSSQSPGPERRSRLSSPLLQRRQPGFSSPASQRRSLEVSSPRVPPVPPVCYSTSSLQRRRPDKTDQPHLHHLQPPHYSPQVNRRSVPLEQNSPYLQRRLTLERSSITVLASLDKSILQIR